MFPMFIFPCSLAFMFACTFAFAFARLVAGLGDAATVAFELTFVLLFEFSEVLQAVAKTAIASKVRKVVDRRRISVPPVCNTSQMRVIVKLLLQWP